MTLLRLVKIVSGKAAVSDEARRTILSTLSLEAR